MPLNFSEAIIDDGINELGGAAEYLDRADKPIKDLGELGVRLAKTVGETWKDAHRYMLDPIGVKNMGGGANQHIEEATRRLSPHIANLPMDEARTAMQFIDQAGKMAAQGVEGEPGLETIAHQADEEMETIADLLAELLVRSEKLQKLSNAMEDVRVTIVGGKTPEGADAKPGLLPTASHSLREIQKKMRQGLV